MLFPERRDAATSGDSLPVEERFFSVQLVRSTTVPPTLYSSTNSSVGAPSLPTMTSVITICPGSGGVDVGAGGGIGISAKLAVTVTLLVISKTHTPSPEHAPDQPEKELPALALSEREMRVPSEKVFAQSLAQSRPLPKTAPVAPDSFCTTRESVRNVGGGGEEGGGVGGTVATAGKVFSFFGVPPTSGEVNHERSARRAIVLFVAASPADHPLRASTSSSKRQSALKSFSHAPLLESAPA